MRSGSGFSDVVVREFGFLGGEYGFAVVRQGGDVVEFESLLVRVVATFDPRGEVEVVVTRRDSDSGFGRVTFGGQVGTASVERLVQMAAEQLRREESALEGDAEFFDLLAEAQSRNAEAWTAYHAGRGPRPKTGKLP